MPVRPTKQCLLRLQKEYRSVQKDPNPLFQTAPDPFDILVWYFIFDGPQDTPYAGGRYLGRLKLPPDYPYKPPSIMLCTPNGRFQPETAICLSNSSYHPEHWNPMWSVGTIITGLVSFLTASDATSGSVSTTTEEKVMLARQSRAYNVEKLGPAYRSALPEQFEADRQMLAKGPATEEAETAPASSPAGALAAGDEGEGSRGAREDVATTTGAAAADLPAASTARTTQQRHTLQHQERQEQHQQHRKLGGYSSLYTAAVVLMLAAAVGYWSYHGC